MDKYEYKVRAEEIKALISEGEFTEAVQIADTIDWRRVKSVMMLCTISDLYKINRRFQESKDILLMAYERHPGGRLIVYSLCELSVKMGEIVQAIEYYKEFVQIAPKDTGRYILQYKLYEAQDVSLEERIAVLEEFKKRDYREKWAYELAYLYHRVGLETKCVEECDEMILWFGEGRHIIKALELKQLHQPLSVEQQEKYSDLKRIKNEQIDAAANEYHDSQDDEENDVADQMQHVQEYEAGSEEFSQDESDMDFHVKPVDVGQYNTINLQKELAKSMQELLGEGQASDEPEQEPGIGTITESIIAPLMQETEDMEPAMKQAEAVIESKVITSFENRKQMEDPLPSKAEVSDFLEEIDPAMSSTEEIFFEDIKDVLTEDTKEIRVENIGDTKELKPSRRIIYPPTDAEISRESNLREQETPSVQVSHILQMPSQTRPSGFERMLSQEYDGQISLVVPEKLQIEKQITGQISIMDVLSEWEKMKKHNEEKRREDVRRRVQQHTGNLLLDFEEAAKSGLLERLEEGTGGADPHIEAVSIPQEAQPPKQQEAPVPEVVDKAEQAAVISEEEMPETTTPEQAVIAPEPEAVKEQTLAELPAAPQTDEVQAASGDQAEGLKEALEDVNKSRPLSEEEKEIFRKYISTKKAREQIIHAVDTMSMDSYTDNIVVTGDVGAGTLEVAKGLIRMMQMSDSNFSGKVAKIAGNTLNKKSVQDTMLKLADGAVIIEQADEMMQKTAEDLNKTLSQNSRGLLVILLGSKEKMNQFFNKNQVLNQNFNARIDVEALNDHALVEFAKQYAQEQEYSIDELGILALHTRIADMQTSDHEVTIEEVKDLVDDAIYFADKKNLKHLFDVLFGKRYDEEDMIILTEKDFMHY